MNCIGNKRPRIILLASSLVLLLVVLRATPQSGKPPAPRIKVLYISTNRSVTIRVSGSAGRTNIIEASADLRTWTPIATNVMNASLCPICPFADVVDTASINQARRFYRCRELY